MQTTLAGEIEHVTYHNPENGFCVLKVRLRGRRELATVTGNLTTVNAGEHVEAIGDWRIDPRHGRQFQAQSLRTTHPATPDGIQRYLASGAIRSVGPKLAERIVSLYQERSLEIIEHYSDMLLHIRGVGPARLKRIRESWQQQRAVRDIMLFLHGHGVSTGRAARIYQRYGNESIPLIRENPYRLAEDIRGIGFKTADQLAMRLGLDRHSPHRARAAVRHTLQELTHAGHCAYPAAQVEEHVTQLVEIPREIVADAIEEMVGGRQLVRDVQDGDPWLWLPPLDRAERGIADSLQRLLREGRHPLPRIDVEKALAWVQKKLQLSLAPAQADAVRHAVRDKVLVVTGGPGVGKTTLVRSILEVFAAKDCRCVLAAPTGRAAKRLAETTGRPAKTIHRLLDFDPANGSFRRGPDSPLRGDLFVIDEVSMVDVVLAHQLLRSIPEHAALLLVGDVDQLPSVGPGSFLADLIASHQVPVVRLTQIFRQSQESRIVTSAHAINEGRLPRLGPEGGELSDFYFVDCDTPEAVRDMMVKLVCERIPSRFQLDPFADIQVLTPMNRSLLGARNLNQVFQAALNPDESRPSVERYGWLFREGDRVIQTENNYDRQVFNGDQGIIREVNRIEQEVKVDFDGHVVDYDFTSLDELALSYVLTVHKSQGSEYAAVVIPLHTQHFLMLQRNLLYTAVTRGKRLVVLVGSRKALALAIRRHDSQLRYSALRDRLRKLGMGGGPQIERS